jgi:hypothetical protein
MSLRLLFVSLALCDAHSWLLQIGNRGLRRGGLEGSDEDKTEYFCPTPDVKSCVAPSSNVPVSLVSTRACRPGRSPVLADAEAGGPLFLGWQGNGHVGKADGTCVKVGIAPYASDPEVSSFQTLVECAPYNHGFSPDTTVTLPESLAAGEYTIHWVWSYAGFYYSSCADINVQPPSAGGAKPSQPKISVEESLALDYNALDCAAVTDPDGACIARFGPSTYCLTWIKNTCGRSWCQGHDPVISDCTLNTSQGSSTTVKPSAGTTTTSGPTTTTKAPTGTSDNKLLGCEKQAEPHGYCRKEFGTLSYCKLESKDDCGRSWCFSQVFMPSC